MALGRERSEFNKAKMVVGMDIGRYSVQISYMRQGMTEPETAEQVMGSEVFNIPMLLCKRVGVNQWFYGREALKYHEKEGGYLVDNILQKAIDGRYEVIENENIDSVALLTLFIKRSLSILGGSHLAGGISDIMFTCESLGSRVVEVMSRVAANLQLKNCNVYFQSYAESIYNYVIHQDPTVWNYNVLFSYFDGKKSTNFVFKRNMRTTPIVAFVEETEPVEMALPEYITEDTKPAMYERFDDQYVDLMKNIITDDYFSGVYLVGDGFKEPWADKTLRYLGRNRRLFIGNDIFSRGACYSLMDKYEPTEEATGHVFLGMDKLRCNVGIEVLRRGKESYLALLDAGLNWYDANACYEMFMPADNIFKLVLIPLDGSGHIEHDIVIDNPPDRDFDSLRMELSMSMTDVSTVRLLIKDLGFGELYPSSGMEWEFTINL